MYIERLRREYKVETEVGRPRVNYREAITRAADFDYLHKKQSGGQGQYGRVIGRIEPLPEGSAEKFEFVNALVGAAIAPGFVTAIEKGFREAAQSGALIGYPVEAVRVTLTDGASHAVDSSELAFKIAALNAFRQACEAAGPVVLEPVMKVEVTVPLEFQGAIVGSLNRRKGVIMNSDQQGDDALLFAEVPLNNMFGYSTELRSMTQGKGEFTMEYLRCGRLPVRAVLSSASQRLLSHPHPTRDAGTQPSRRTCRRSSSSSASPRRPAAPARDALSTRRRRRRRRGRAEAAGGGARK